MKGYQAVETIGCGSKVWRGLGRSLEKADTHAAGQQFQWQTGTRSHINGIKSGSDSGQSIASKCFN